MFNPFEDPLADLLNKKRSSSEKATAKPLPQIRGKSIGGVKWLRAEDVKAALEANNPKANELLIERIARFLDAS